MLNNISYEFDTDDVLDTSCIDLQWMLAEIEKISLLSKENGQIGRLAFTEAEQRVRQYIIELIKSFDFSVRVDAIGNIIARLPGDEDKGSPVISGSHLDTVPGGGKYDGVVGVIGALAALQAVRKMQVTHPLELVVFAAEESSRFNFATIGSKAMAGQANLHAWKKAVDAKGITFCQALAAVGLSMENIHQAARTKEKIRGFVELCIDQSGVLINEEGSLGIMEIIAAPTRLKITIEGVAAHSGTTPIEERQDALVSAAMIILAVQEIAVENAYYGTVATVGNVLVHPGVINMVPGRVEMWVDIRGTDHENVIETMQDLKDSISTIADGQETAASIEVLSSDKPVHLNKQINQLVENICLRDKISFRRFNCGAGYDAMNMSQLTAAALICIPYQSVNNEHDEEVVDLQELLTGVRVLAETLYHLAK